MTQNKVLVLGMVVVILAMIIWSELPVNLFVGYFMIGFYLLWTLKPLIQEKFKKELV